MEPTLQLDKMTTLEKIRAMEEICLTCQRNQQMFQFQAGIPKYFLPANSRFSKNKPRLLIGRKSAS